MKLHSLFVVILATAVAGCSAHTQYVGVNPIKVIAGDYKETVVLTENPSLWIGFIEVPWYTDSDVEEKCPTKMGYIKKYKSFGASLLQFLTIGIYTSIEVEIGCMADAGTSLILELTREQALAIATSEGFVEGMAAIDPAFEEAAARAQAVALLEAQP